MIKKFLKFLVNPNYRFLILSNQGKYRSMPDEDFLKKKFRIRMGQELDLENPKTFNEKLQWLKLYNRQPIYTTMVDKYAVKQYVTDQIGSEYVIPTLGVWDHFDEIDFDSLPDRFVLKVTHDSGGIAICKDKKTFDKEAARAKIEKSLKRDYYNIGREWPYKNVKPRILAETFLENAEGKELVEYKIFCFNGEAKIILVCKGQAHGNGRTNDYCDTNLQRFPFTSLYPNSKGELDKPALLPELLKTAEKLSQGIPQVRVDLYICNNQIYFGEFTFFHNSGFCSFDPKEWDETLGSWIKLPKKQGETL